MASSHQASKVGSRVGRTQIAGTEHTRDDRKWILLSNMTSITASTLMVQKHYEHRNTQHRTTKYRRLSLLSWAFFTNPEDNRGKNNIAARALVQNTRKIAFPRERVIRDNTDKDIAASRLGATPVNQTFHMWISYVSADTEETSISSAFAPALRAVVNNTTAFISLGTFANVEFRFAACSKARRQRSLSPSPFQRLATRTFSFGALGLLGTVTKLQPYQVRNRARAARLQKSAPRFVSLRMLHCSGN